MTITSFADPLQAARAKSEPQRLASRARRKQLCQRVERLLREALDRVEARDHCHRLLVATANALSSISAAIAKRYATIC